MMRHAWMLVLALGLWGCSENYDRNNNGIPDKDETTTSRTEPKAEANVPAKAQKAASIAQQIKQNKSVDQVLQQQNMDRDDLDDLMYDVAKDHDLSTAYLDARDNPNMMRQ